MVKIVVENNAFRIEAASLPKGIMWIKEYDESPIQVELKGKEARLYLYYDEHTHIVEFTGSGNIWVRYHCTSGLLQVGFDSHNYSFDLERKILDKLMRDMEKRFVY